MKFDENNYSVTLISGIIYIKILCELKCLDIKHFYVIKLLKHSILF